MWWRSVAVPRSHGWVSVIVCFVYLFFCSLSRLIKIVIVCVSLFFSVLECFSPRWQQLATNRPLQFSEGHRGEWAKSLCCVLFTSWRRLNLISLKQSVQTQTADWVDCSVSGSGGGEHLKEMWRFSSQAEPARVSGCRRQRPEVSVALAGEHGISSLTAIK